MKNASMRLSEEVVFGYVKECQSGDYSNYELLQNMFLRLISFKRYKYKGALEQCDAEVRASALLFQVISTKKYELDNRFIGRTVHFIRNTLYCEFNEGKKIHHETCPITDSMHALKEMQSISTFDAGTIAEELQVAVLAELRKLRNARRIEQRLAYNVFLHRLLFPSLTQQHLAKRLQMQDTLLSSAMIVAKKVFIRVFEENFTY